MASPRRVNQMHISMFGPLRISRSGAVLGPGDFGGVKPKELFELLLLGRGHPVHKDSLIEELWPGTPPRNPTGTLESYVSILRKYLFEDRDQARRMLTTMSGAYRFALDEVTLDLDTFDQLIARAERSPSKRLPLLQQAADLAVGDLLEDVPANHWIDQPRAMYRDRVARVHLLIAADLIIGGNYSSAVWHGERVLTIRPYSEEAVQTIMLANHALGHSELARRVFERCRKVLADDLNTDCTSETENLGAAIDAGTPASTLIAQRWPPPPASPASRRRSERRDRNRILPFLGRDHELALVGDRCAASAVNGFQLIVIRGRRGMGRTAFLGELDRRLRGPVGRCTYTPLDSERPTVPLATALQAALHGTAGAHAAKEYAEAPFVDSSPETLIALYSVIADHAPITLLLDDLHWADADTFTALDWLGRRHPELPLTVVATMRDHNLHNGQHRTLRTITETIQLGVLAAEHANDRHGLDAALIRATGGVPALIADCWRWTRSGGSGVPPSVRDVVLRTVRGLGGSPALLLRVAATYPEPFDELDLMPSLTQSVPEIATTIDALCALDMLERVADGVRFRSSMIRDVLASTSVAALASRRLGAHRAAIARDENGDAVEGGSSDRLPVNRYGHGVGV